MGSVLVGAILGVVAVVALAWAMNALPASWFDDRALMRPMELPDEAAVAAQREVDELAPAAPRTETPFDAVVRAFRERQEFNERTRQPQVDDRLRRAWKP